MECVFCTGGERTSSWFSDLCNTHRSEYVANKRFQRLEEKRKLRQITQTKNAVCAEFGHSYVFYQVGKEMCRRCGLVIANRQVLKENSQEYHRNRISEGLFAGKYLTRMFTFYTSIPVIWHSKAMSAKVANGLYYLRYNMRWSAEKICKELGMPPSTLNAYLCNFPAIVRNGKIVVLSD